MSKRKIVCESLGSESFYDILDGKTPEQVIEHMQGVRAYYGDRDVYFDIQGYGYDGGKELYMYERRLETDKEYDKRIAEEKKVKAKAKEAKATKEAREFLEYQRLQKKFQGKSVFNG
jgi:hypothetical protein